MNIIYNCLADAIKKANIEQSKISIVSDFLYQPEIIDFLGVDSFYVTRGRSIPFATGLKMGNPDLKVIVLAGDLITLGGNHFMHSARRNMDLSVICINNFIYPEIDGKKSPLTTAPFSLYATFERPINIPHLARSSGAVYVARWTSLHKTELTDSITHILTKRGFSVIEVIAPGTCYFAGTPDLPRNAEILDFYYKNSVLKNGEDTRNVEITQTQKIFVGKFFEQEKPTFIDSYNSRLSEILGDKFKPYG